MPLGCARPRLNTGLVAADEPPTQATSPFCHPTPTHVMSCSAGRGTTRHQARRTEARNARIAPPTSPVTTRPCVEACTTELIRDSEACTVHRTSPVCIPMHTKSHGQTRPHAHSATRFALIFPTARAPRTRVTRYWRVPMAEPTAIRPVALHTHVAVMSTSTESRSTAAASVSPCPRLLDRFVSPAASSSVFLVVHTALPVCRAAVQHRKL